MNLVRRDLVSLVGELKTGGLELRQGVRVLASESADRELDLGDRIGAL